MNCRTEGPIPILDSNSCVFKNIGKQNSTIARNFCLCGGCSLYRVHYTYVCCSNPRRTLISDSIYCIVFTSRHLIFFYMECTLDWSEQYTPLIFLKLNIIDYTSRAAPLYYCCTFPFTAESRTCWTSFCICSWSAFIFKQCASFALIIICLNCPLSIFGVRCLSLQYLQ